MRIMKKFFLPFVLPMLIFLASPAPASADEGTSWSELKWEKTVGGLKGETDDLLKQNETLNEEYKLLQQKLSDLQISVKGLNQEVFQQEKENERLRQLREEKKEKQQAWAAQVEKMKQDIAAAEQENERLSAALTAEIDKTGVLRDKLGTLAEKKRELLLDLKMQDIKRQELKSDEEARLKDKEAQLEKVREEEQAVSQQVLELQTQEDSLLDEIESVKKESLGLETKVAELTRQRAEKIKENDALRKQIETASAAPLQVPPALAAEKQALQTEVTALEQQLEALRSSVSESSQVIDKKRDLMNEIMKMDAENQDLRQRINALTEKINSLQ